MKKSLLLAATALSLGFASADAKAEKCPAPTAGLKATVGGHLDINFKGAASKTVNGKAFGDGDDDVSYFANHSGMGSSEAKLRFTVEGSHGMLHYGGVMKLNLLGFKTDSEDENTRKLSAMVQDANIFMKVPFVEFRFGRQKAADNVLAHATLMGGADWFGKYGMVNTGHSYSVTPAGMEAVLANAAADAFVEEANNRLNWKVDSSFASYANRLLITTDRFMPINGNGGLMFALSITPDNTAEFARKSNDYKMLDNLNLTGGLNLDYELVNGAHFGLAGVASYQATADTDSVLGNHLNYHFGVKGGYKDFTISGFMTSNMGAGMDKEEYETAKLSSGTFFGGALRYCLSFVMGKPTISAGMVMGSRKDVLKLNDTGDGWAAADNAADQSVSHFAGGVDFTMAPGLNAYLGAEYISSENVVFHKANAGDKKVDNSELNFKAGLGLSF